MTKLDADEVRLPQDVISADEFGALPPAIRNAVAACESATGDEKEFHRRVKSLRFLVSTEQIKQFSGCHVEAVNRVLTFYRKVLHAQSILFSRVSNAAYSDVDDAEVVALLVEMRDAYDSETAAGFEVACMLRDRLANMLFPHVREFMDDPEIVSALDRASERRRLKDKRRRKRKFAAARDNEPDDHAGVIYSDIPQSSWIARLMFQRSSAGERVKPGFAVRNGLPDGIA